METKVWLVEIRFANTLFLAMGSISLYCWLQYCVFEFDVFMFTSILFTFVTSLCAFAMLVKDPLLLLIGINKLSEFSIFCKSGLNLSFMKSWIFMFYLKYSVLDFLSMSEK